MNIRNFCASKDTINRVQRQPTEWEKIHASHSSDKGLTSKIHRGLLKLSNKKVPIFNTSKIFEQTFLQIRYINDQ